MISRISHVVITDCRELKSTGLGCPLIVLTFASRLMRVKWLNVEIRHASTVWRSRKPIILPVTKGNWVTTKGRLKSDGANKS